MGTVPVDEKTMMPIQTQALTVDFSNKKDASMPEMAKPTNYISVESVEEYSKKVEAFRRQDCCAEDGDSGYGLVGSWHWIPKATISAS